MNCPSCGERMEYENAPEVSKGNKLAPCVLYRCDDCDADFVMRHGRFGGRLMLLDAGDGYRRRVTTGTR